MADYMTKYAEGGEGGGHIATISENYIYFFLVWKKEQTYYNLDSLYIQQNWLVRAENAAQLFLLLIFFLQLNFTATAGPPRKRTKLAFVTCRIDEKHENKLSLL